MKNNKTLNKRKILSLIAMGSIIGAISSIFVIRKNTVDYITQENVEVEILSVDKKNGYLIPTTTQLIKKEPTYITNILYDNNEYAVYGKETYDKYKNRIDEKTMATFNIIKYKYKEDEYKPVSLK